jgi:16S rRNA G966 N2-methylase RsmD
MRVMDNRIVSLFGRDFLGMTTRQRNYWLGRAHRYWRREGFPYPTLSDDERKREFAVLRRVAPTSIIQRNLIAHSTIGLRLANAFHPQMWHVPIHGRSAVDVFGDDDRLIRALCKAAAFWPNRRCWNGQCLRSVLRIMHRQRVSNFRPTVAMALLHRYSGTGESILDFSAGYGGRLLGALAVGCKYTGIDPAMAQIDGLRSMTQALESASHGSAKVIQGCAEEILPKLPSRSFSAVLSSPPYFNNERYSDEVTQSCIRYPAYGQWKDRFLKVAIGESSRILEKNGHLLLNVANTDRFPIATDAEAICRHYFGRPVRILRMLMTVTPSERSRLTGPTYRSEPVYVFKKS